MYYTCTYIVHALFNRDQSFYSLGFCVPQTYIKIRYYTRGVSVHIITLYVRIVNCFTLFTLVVTNRRLFFMADARKHELNQISFTT